MDTICKHCERVIRATDDGKYLHDNGLRKCLPEEMIEVAAGAPDAHRTEAEL